MARFSERMGYVTLPVQRETIDTPLKNVIWNAIYGVLNVDADFDATGRIVDVWQNHWHLPADQLRNSWTTARNQVRDHYYQLPWHGIMDLLEHFSLDGLEVEFNTALEAHRSAYRLVDHKVVEITDAASIEAIESSLESSEPYPGVRVHLQSAVACLAKRPKADYPNAMKEAISSVETLVGLLVGKPGATLGQALKDLKNHLAVHPGLVASWSALYGYASEEPGVRHGSGTGVPTVGHADAMHMLVTCSAIVSYLIELKIKQGT